LLFVAHDLGVVAVIADRVLVLERGRLCEEGSTQQILTEPPATYTRELIETAPSVSAWQALVGEADRRQGCTRQIADRRAGGNPYFGGRGSRS
jgi:peptide/nickel transport system ATP-binding protein